MFSDILPVFIITLLKMLCNLANYQVSKVIIIKIINIKRELDKQKCTIHSGLHLHLKVHQICVAKKPFQQSLLLKHYKLQLFVNRETSSSETDSNTSLQVVSEVSKIAPVSEVCKRDLIGLALYGLCCCFSFYVCLFSLDQNRLHILIFFKKIIQFILVGG